MRRFASRAGAGLSDIFHFDISPCVWSQSQLILNMSYFSNLPFSRHSLHFALLEQ